VAEFTINIDLDKKCTRCKKPGATTAGGLCLECVAKGIKEGKYDHIIRRQRGVLGLVEDAANAEVRQCARCRNVFVPGASAGSLCPPCARVVVEDEIAAQGGDLE